MTQQQRSWLEEFEHEPPVEYPFTIEYTLRGLGKQTGTFEAQEQFAAGVQFAKYRLTPPEREDIEEQVSRTAALTMLWRKIAVNDFFKTYGARKASNENIKAYNTERAERLRTQRMSTMQRLRRDIDELHTRADDLLIDPDLPSADLLDLARSAGSVHTRLRQMGMAAERREWNSREEPI